MAKFLKTRFLLNIHIFPQITNQSEESPEDESETVSKRVDERDQLHQSGEEIKSTKDKG